MTTFVLDITDKARSFKLNLHNMYIKDSHLSVDRPMYMSGHLFTAYGYDGKYLTYRTKSDIDFMNNRNLRHILRVFTTNSIERYVIISV